MKKTLLSLFTLVLAISASAQHFEEGAKFFHAGLGVISPYAYTGSKMGVPPIHVSGEIGITDDIGIGGLIGYTSSKYRSAFWASSYEWTFTYLIIGARGNYHFYQDEKFDAYGGVMLGYNVSNSKFKSNDPDLVNWVIHPKTGGMAYGLYLGGRYFFQEKAAIFAEVGYNIGWINVGYCAKF